MWDYFLLVAGLLLLVLGGEFLLKSAVATSLRLKIPKIIVGLTIVSFATSAPELIVSVNSAINGQPGIAIGNVIGSNIANIGFVFGITILLMPIKVYSSFLREDLPILVYVSGLFFLLIFFDGYLSFWEGIFLLVNIFFYIIYLIKFRQKNDPDDDIDDQLVQLNSFYILFYLLLGGIGLWQGSELLIKGAVNIAKNLGVSDAIIGLTVVSIGTSIPELVASLIAVFKKEKSIGLGNIVGSNIFNILSVLGITAIIKTIPIEERFITTDAYWMIFLVILLLPLALMKKRLVFHKLEGIILLSFYLLYIYFCIN